MIPKVIYYNGHKYGKHPDQPYYYNTNSKPYRLLHRQMWYDANGLIPDGYHVHHINRIATDNRLENFELKAGEDHCRDHGHERDLSQLRKLAEIGRQFAPAWHRSEEGRKWHRENAKKMGLSSLTYGTKACENCNRVFTLKQKSGRFCSNACKSAYRRKHNPDKKIAECLTCGKEFETLKYLPNKYCSKECKPAPNPNGGRRKIQKI